MISDREVVERYLQYRTDLGDQPEHLNRDHINLYQLMRKRGMEKLIGKPLDQIDPLQFNREERIKRERSKREDVPKNPVQVIDTLLDVIYSLTQRGYLHTTIELFVRKAYERIQEADGAVSAERRERYFDLLQRYCNSHPEIRLRVSAKDSGYVLERRVSA